MPAPARLTLVLLLAASVLAGCERGSDAPAATEAALPGSLFVSSPPESSVALITAKTDAKPGDRVVFEARIGGRRDPFVEDRAVFFVADPSLLSCDQLHGDGCPTPWDYCCEAKDSLLRHMATVQVVDETGRPLKVSLSDRHGLKPLRTIVVQGTVDQADESGAFVVNAETIHVREG